MNWDVVGAVRMVARSEWRRQRWALVALAAVVAIGLGASLAAFAAAYRTEHAYPDYVRDAAVTDLVVNPLLPTDEFAQRLRAIPHIRNMWTQDLLTAGVGEWHPMTAGAAALDTTSGEGIGSVDGRYAAADRMMIDEGRAPTGVREVFVTDNFRPILDRRLGHHVAIGERIPVAFLYPPDIDTDLTGTFDRNKIVQPIGTERLRVTGFGRLPDEVFDDDLFPRQRFVVSPDITRKYSCAASLPDASIEEIYVALEPPGCSRTYRYWALDVDTRANVPKVAKAITALTNDLNRRLPAALRQDPSGYGYFPILTTQSDLDARVQHSVRPTVVALVLFGSLAGIATLVLVILAMARIVRGNRRADTTVHALGMARGARTASAALPSLVLVAIGITGAVVVGYLGSRIGPTGQVRRAQPHAHFSMPAAVAMPVVGAFAAVFAVSLAAVAMWAVRAPQRGSVPRSRWRGPALTVSNPAAADGVHNALATRRGGALVTGGCCVVVAALVGAGMFGANLTRLVDHPERYGWPWDVGVLTGGGYGGTNLDLVKADLDRRDDVASYDELGFISGTLDGKNIAVVVASSAAPAVDLPIVEGRAPRKPGEVALGTVTADRLGLDVGDVTTLEANGGPTKLRVVGTTVLPAVGPLFADRAGLGLGALSIAPPGEMRGDFVTFIGVHLKPHADARALVANMRPRFIAWDATATVPNSYSGPIRPSEIVDASEMQRGPMILAGLLAVALLGALVLSVTATVNARRRDFAIYRAIGFTRGQVASSVCWLALTSVAVGLLVGIPSGLLVGRFTWRRFASDLGVGPDVTTPRLFVAAVAVVALVVAVLAAAGPARRAGRMPPAEVLHTQ